jgi:hypothetical protein
MQHEGNRHLEEIINAADDHVKRTTIILEKKERDFIDSLIREGKEPGIKSLISKMLSIYKNMMINEWRFPGEYYYGISRVAFINIEILNILIQQLPPEKLYETGKNIGAALKVSLETTFGLRNDEDWEEIFYRLKIQGFGDFYLKDKYILVKSPFINYSELWRGILESLFDVKLDTKASVPPLVFEIRAHSQTG